MRLHVEAGHARRAGSGFDQSGENLDGRGLAGGVGAEDGEKLAARHGQAEIVDRDEVPEFLDDVQQFDHASR